MDNEQLQCTLPKKDLNKRKYEFDKTNIEIDSDDDGNVFFLIQGHSNKKRKINDVESVKDKDRYFLVTTNEDSSVSSHEFNVTHKLFEPLINAFKTREIKESDDYPMSEIKLYTIMTQYPLDNDVPEVKFEEDYNSIVDFLSVENIEEKDFIGILKSEALYDIEKFRKEALNGRVLFMYSWC
jgi:hypothetical protein